MTHEIRMTSMTEEDLAAQLNDRWDTSPVARSIDVGPGWYRLISDLDRQIREIYPDYTIVQIKEKFGGLRYYIGGVTEEHYDAVQKLIGEAEALSHKTCEQCGGPGKEQGDGWVRTLCDQDQAAFLRRRAERDAEWEKNREDRETAKRSASDDKDQV